MPEGHTVHRTAREFQRNFAGKALRVSSPQGRFDAASKRIDGIELVASQAVGKQLFLYFENGETVRIHLGIYGKWRFEDFDGALPEPIGQVRVRFASDSRIADLRGPTACELLSHEEVVAVIADLGPDPLAKNVDEQQARFVSNVLRSKAAIGQLLMNQKVISGVGNVYRAELLFRAGLNPYRPGSSLNEDSVSELWFDAVKLLEVGFRKGVMITREEFFTGRLPLKSERNFVYKRENQACRKCGSTIRMEIMATRKLYFCPVCQA